MKQLFLLFLFVFSVLNVFAEEQEKQLVVWNKDGSKVAYSLGETPKITFSTDQVLIESNEVLITYPLEKLLRFTYEISDNTSIENVTNDQMCFQYNKDSFRFHGLKENSNVSIYAMNGTLIFRKNIEKNCDFIYPISHLKSGVYIVDINGLSYKIYIK